MHLFRRAYKNSTSAARLPYAGRSEPILDLDLFLGAEIPLPAQRRWTCSSRAVALLAFVVALLTPLVAGAQQKTLYLDRLTMSGAPDDGFAVWRPFTAERTRLFAQMGLGLTFSLPLLRTISKDNNPALQTYSKSPVSPQLIDYATVGAEIARARRSSPISRSFSIRTVATRRPPACEAGHHGFTGVDGRAPRRARAPVQGR
jgi:hypothetical protein